MEMNKPMSFRVATFLGMMLCAAFCAATARAEMKPETTAPIRIVVEGISDADFITRVYGKILERVGYNVEYVNADLPASFAGMMDGDLAINLIWDSTYYLANDALKSGKVVLFGSTGVEIEEGWWYPAYMTEICPGLPDYKALLNPKCIAALTTPETAPKGRFVDAPASSGTYSEEVVKKYDLPLEVVSAGSPGALAATVDGLVSRKAPVLSWGYIPHWVFDQPGVGFVQFPGITTRGYAWKLATKAIMDRVPLASRLFYLFTIDKDTVGKAMHAIDVEGKPLDAVALEWVDANETTWRKWIR
jgi:glycine betaine/proline transport system substrate-binding protein